MTDTPPEQPEDLAPVAREPVDAAPLPVVRASAEDGLAARSGRLAVGAASKAVALVDDLTGGLGSHRAPRALDAAIGAAAAVGGAGMSLADAALGTVARLGHPVAGLVAHPPLLPSALHPGTVWDHLSERGWRIRRDGEWEVERFFDAVVPEVVNSALDRIDLTALVLDRVDVDAIVAGADLPGIAEYVMDEIDLPEVIRDSTGSVASETLRGARMQGIDADQALQGFVDRFLRRRRARSTDAPGEVPGEVTASDRAATADQGPAADA